jgi:hypothetical protein
VARQVWESGAGAPFSSHDINLQIIRPNLRRNEHYQYYRQDYNSTTSDGKLNNLFKKN